MSPESPLTKRHSSSTCATSPSTKRRTQGQGSPNSLRRFTASPDSPTMRRHMGSSTGSSLPVSSRSRTNSIDSPGTRHRNIKYLSPQEQGKNLPRSEGLLGSGEYDRLDQLAEQYSPVASSYSNHHIGYEQSRDYSSLDRKGMIRLANRIHVYHTEINMWLHLVHTFPQVYEPWQWVSFLPHPPPSQSTPFHHYSCYLPLRHWCSSLRVLL